jgi:IclR family mhp operon transcriptional activator
MSDDTIQGLARGLRVLALLETHPSLSLAELHAATGLPKPSLLRVLKTLEEQGYARRRLANGAWRARARHSRLIPTPLNDLLVDVGEGELDLLRRRVVWPSDLAVYHDGMMELLETTARQVRIMVDRVGVGHRVHMLSTGIGRCFLAYCPDDQREDILERLRRSDDPFDRPARDAAPINAMIARVREAGYGLRDTGYSNLPGSISHQMSGAGLPIFANERLIACLSFVWLGGAIDEATFEHQYLSMLQRTAKTIGEQVAAQLAAL